MITVSLIREAGPAADRVLACAGDAGNGGRRRSVVARALLRLLLGRATGSPPGHWLVSADPSGRPVAVPHAGGRQPPPSVAISHSGGWVACAVGLEGTVGIDIEVHRPRRGIAEIAGAAFGPAERGRLAAGGAAAFYRIWTLREAIAKACGLGLSMVTDRRDRAASGPECGGWTVELDGIRWYLAHAVPQENLSLALAVREPPAAMPAPTWWQPEPAADAFRHPDHWT